MVALVLLNTWTVSASTAEDMTLFIVIHWVKISPFYLTKRLTGLVGCLLR